MLLSDSTSNRLVTTGTGSPEGAVTASVGAVYTQSDASPTSLATWIKITGTGNTGWVRQADAELLALAGLTSAADKIPYFTGSGTAALLTRDTDGTLAADSDTVLATQKAVKTYVDTEVAGAGGGATNLDGLSDVAITSPAVPQAIGYNGSSWVNMGSLPKKLFDSTLGTGANSIDTGAAGIAGGYDVLDVYLLLRTDETAVASTVTITVNNDTAGNYDRQFVRGVTATASASTGAAEAGWLLGAPGASVTRAGVFAFLHITIPCYTQTTAEKVGEMVGGWSDSNTSNRRAETQTLAWRSTAAITRMAVTAPSTKNFVAGSRMLIYGR